MDIQIMFVAPIGIASRQENYIRVSVALPLRQEETVWATVFLHGSAERLDTAYSLMQQHKGRLLVAGALTQMRIYNGRLSVTVSAREWQFMPRHESRDAADDAAHTEASEAIAAEDIPF